MGEKRRSVGFGAIHCFGSSKEKKKIKVWNFGMDYLYGNYHKPYLFMGC